MQGYTLMLIELLLRIVERYVGGFAPNFGDLWYQTKHFCKHSCLSHKDGWYDNYHPNFNLITVGNDASAEVVAPLSSDTTASNWWLMSSPSSESSVVKSFGILAYSRPGTDAGGGSTCSISPDPWKEISTVRCTNRCDRPVIAFWPFPTSFLISNWSIRCTKCLIFFSFLFFSFLKNPEIKKKGLPS